MGMESFDNLLSIGKRSNGRLGFIDEVSTFSSFKMVFIKADQSYVSNTCKKKDVWCEKSRKKEKN